MLHFGIGRNRSCEIEKAFLWVYAWGGGKMLLIKKFSFKFDSEILFV